MDLRARSLDVTGESPGDEWDRWHHSFRWTERLLDYSEPRVLICALMLGELFRECFYSVMLERAGLLVGKAAIC